MGKEKEIQLGDRVRDKISGFEGIATGRTEWLYGCIRISVQSENLDENGKVIPAPCFDEPQLELIKAAVIEDKKEIPEHGPRPDPVRPSIPKRD